MTIKEKLFRLKETKKSINLMALDAIIATKDAYLELNKEQMSEGKKADGSVIGYYTFDWYKEKKQKMFPESKGHINLELTGAYKAGMRLKATWKKYEVFSSDSKAKLLKGFYWWDDDIHRLTDENYDHYRREWFYPEFRKRLKRYLNAE